MRNVVNKHQARAWNGYEGEHWAQHQDRYDALVSGFNEHIFGAAAIRAGERVLDIGCGTGQTTRIAARRAVHGHATGVDLSAPMLARARAVAASDGITNVTFEQGDAQVFPFPASGFDVAISRGGIMYFADPVAAFTNIGHALRPGGRFVFIAGRSAGDDNDGMVIFRALADHVPQARRAPDDDSPSPDSLDDPEHTRAILHSSGFANVRIEAVKMSGILGKDADDAAAFVLGWGPVHYDFQQAGVTDTEPARAAVAAALRPLETQDGVRMRADAWLVSATR
ncbi:methyltransferase domain-containing protein [Actinomadura fulvescens]|uniref:Class I SAM-dependent methyltransferase n=1 Tax=Actinomadura fulvescens TaxID=46160 RepID=A0ABN3QLV8_9ACTN